MTTPFKSVADLKVGTIVEVSGSTVKVELSGDVSELTRSYGGRVYPIGQIGSVVKVHFGRRLVFGFVTLLRMRSEELVEMATPIPPDADQRVMEIELFAEGVWNSGESRLTFTRGVSTYPLPRQNVYLLTRDEAGLLYKSAEGQRPDGADPLVPFATYVGADAAQCRANIDKMFSLHCAVLGSTGSGKSGAVAAILHSVLDHHPIDGAVSPKIVIIDPHGEYGRALVAGCGIPCIRSNRNGRDCGHASQTALLAYVGRRIPSACERQNGIRGHVAAQHRLQSTDPR